MSWDAFNSLMTKAHLLGFIALEVFTELRNKLNGKS